MYTLLGAISGILIDNMIANGADAEILVKNIRFGPMFYIPDNLMKLQDQQFVQLVGQFCCLNAFIKLGGDEYDSKCLSLIEGSRRKSDYFITAKHLLSRKHLIEATKVLKSAAKLGWTEAYRFCSPYSGGAKFQNNLGYPPPCWKVFLTLKYTDMLKYPADANSYDILSIWHMSFVTKSV